MSEVRTTEPVAGTEPISLAEARDYCKADAHEHDLRLQFLIQAARDHVEGITGRSLMQQTWTQYMRGFPSSNGGIPLPRPPLQSITSFGYTDTDGDAQTLTSGVDYTLDDSELIPRVVPYYGTSWPSARGEPKSVQIVYVTGYGSADVVPADLRLAMLRLIEHWFDNSSEVVVGTIAAEVPQGAKRILANWTIVEF